MSKTMRSLAALGVASLTLAMSPAAANAADGDSYSGTLSPVNNSGGSGTATVEVQGDQIQVNLNWSGLADKFQGGPFPHVEHIHIGGRNECPTASEDSNGDGIVSTPEGQPAYGKIRFTLSESGDTSPNAATNIKIAPSGSSTTYSRTIPLGDTSASELEGGSIVVHGLNPANQPDSATNDSPIVPKLPLAATAPALCGELSAMPSGGVATGGGDTSGVENAGLYAAGGGLLIGAAGIAAARRRRTSRTGA